jgi:hypothetical protein
MQPTARKSQIFFVGGRITKLAADG